jgi:hypothetical protein
MPKVSKDSGQVEDHGIVLDCHGEVDGYTVSIVEFRQDIDSTPMLKGLPDDLCQCPHWGYVQQGSITVRYADGTEEVTSEGELFYWPGGHTGWSGPEGVTFVEFSPADEIAPVLAHLAKAAG